MAKGEARAIAVRIATRRVFFMNIGVKSIYFYVNKTFRVMSVI